MKDTNAALNDINLSINAGLYEPIRITSNLQFSGLKNTVAWKDIFDRISANRLKYQDPDNLKLYTTDLDNFFKFLPHINQLHADEALMREYILCGSPGLKAFFDLKLNSHPELMISKIRNCLSFYQSIDQLPVRVKKLLPSIRMAAHKLKQYYPSSIFPPIYFIVGIFNIGGTPDIGNGLLIGSEFFAGDKKTDTTELNEKEKFALYDTSRLLPVVIHEFIHIEQKTPWGQTLLEQCIIEGACDFIATLLIGSEINPRLHEYGNAHESELFQKFLKEKSSTDFSNWLYNGSKLAGTNIPPNLGYYIGFKICENYCLKTKDIGKTITDILEISDYEDFFHKSEYAKKFEK